MQLGILVVEAAKLVTEAVLFVAFVAAMVVVLPVAGVLASIDLTVKYMRGR